MFQHPLKKLQFLVGLRGRSELALIGGAWEPVDGADPGSLPHTLVATAARTFKAATGVDLSACAHWFGYFTLEIHSFMRLCMSMCCVSCASTKSFVQGALSGSVKHGRG